MSRWSRKEESVESFSIPTRAQGGWGGSGCGGQLGLRLLLEKPVEAVYYLFCFPLSKGSVYRWEHCASARVVGGQGAGVGAKCCK